MSIFTKIKDAIFGGPARAQAPEPAGSALPNEFTPAPVSTSSARSNAPAASASGNAFADAPVVAPRAVPVFDVTNSLDSMPGADRLNWRTSIVDLMKLIGVDSDYESRKALAVEMGREDYAGTTEDNVWLHQRVMRELAANGGTVPEEFRD